MSSDILVHFYFCIIESIVTAGILTWFGYMSQKDWEWFNRAVKKASRIISRQLSYLEEIYTRHYRKRAQGSINYTTQTGHHLFTLLPSGRRYCNIKTSITEAVRLFNSWELTDAHANTTMNSTIDKALDKLGSADLKVTMNLLEEVVLSLL